MGKEMNCEVIERFVFTSESVTIGFLPFYIEFRALKHLPNYLEGDPSTSLGELL